jgi:UDP-N-acetylglucosamine 2-epimerase
MHRAENANQKTIDWWMEAITYKHKRVFVVLHHRTKKFFKSWKNKVHLMEPMDHQSMLFKLREAEWVYTDSGGLQKEAYWSGCPVTTIGGNPWPEIYAFGFGDAKERIKEHVKKYLKT